MTALAHPMPISVSSSRARPGIGRAPALSRPAKRVTLPAGAATVRVALAGNGRELTMRNNRVALPGVTR